MDKKLYWIWLTQIKGLGPIKIQNLLGYFKNAQGIWNASQEELNNTPGIGSVLSTEIIETKKNFAPRKEREELKKFSVELVTLEDKCYPKLLKEIYAPPPVLYYRGSLAAVNKPCIAVVGTRSCTQYGKRIAYSLSQELAKEGFVVVSGLARGIDTRAHQGALQRGMTYAILGSGFKHLYPPENSQLADGIVGQGAVITPYHLRVEPSKSNFPARNRIISGLSLGTIVIEAPNKSGALITANFSLRQGREVFAVPGDINHRQSQGTNKLIQAGAKLVQDIEDIKEELVLDDFSLHRLNKKANTEQQSNEINLNQKQKVVYNLLNNEEQQFEKILSNVKMKAKELNSILSQLEIMGLIKQVSGKRFSTIT